jgi:hypothetical protein
MLRRSTAAELHMPVPSSSLCRRGRLWVALLAALSGARPIAHRCRTDVFERLGKRQAETRTCATKAAGGVVNFMLRIRGLLLERVEAPAPKTS